MNSNMKILATTMALLFLWAGNGLAGQSHYKLHVNGLVCPFCELNVEKKLKKIDGVLTADANLKDGVVSMLVADGKTLSEDVLRKEITDAGFTLESVEIQDLAQ